MIVVQVIPTNDAPEVKDNIDKLIKSQEVFVYPPVNPDVTVDPLEALAADIVKTFYSDDKDKNTDLVMGLLGYTESYIEDKVGK